MGRKSTRLQKELLRERIADIACGAGIDNIWGEDGDYWCAGAVELERFMLAIQRALVHDHKDEYTRKHTIAVSAIGHFESLNSATDYLWNCGIRA